MRNRAKKRFEESREHRPDALFHRAQRLARQFGLWVLLETGRTGAKVWRIFCGRSGTDLACFYPDSRMLYLVDQPGRKMADFRAAFVEAAKRRPAPKVQAR